MTARLAILCSGQGAQHERMFDLAASDARVAGLLAQWGTLPLQSGADLFANQAAQPLIVAAACAVWESIRARIAPPALVAGYSVGEVAALAVSGMLDAPVAIGLARERARLMDDCIQPETPQGLLAVSGLTQDRLAPWLAGCGLHLAIDNGADQCIVGGAADGLGALQLKAEAAGAHVQRLKVAVASHTPFMQGAVAPLVAAMAQLRWSDPACRLLSGYAATPVVDAQGAVAAMAAQLVQPVRWARCMDAIAEAGVTVALELGPGNGLARMLAARHPGIVCRSAADFRTLDGLVGWVERSRD
ncbi:MAG: acyltransferase domain-containing protein [Herminiimonas sp.]|nr:acyltransferase domain-containing protein [Herminiimonas sp.]